MTELEEKYREAFSEVYAVLQILPNELKVKIPTNFYLMIEKERNPYYHIEIVNPIEKNTFKDETIVLLGLIYRDFLCSEEERKFLQIQDEKKKKKSKSDKKQDIKINGIYKINKKEITDNNSLIVIEKEKIYAKIFKTLKRLILKK